MMGVRNACHFGVGAISLLMAIGSGSGGLSMAMEGNHWPGVALALVTVLLLSLAESAFGRIRPERREDYDVL